MHTLHGGTHVAHVAQSLRTGVIYGIEPRITLHDAVETAQGLAVVAPFKIDEAEVV